MNFFFSRGYFLSSVVAFQLSLSWKNEGAKKVHFRADYRRVFNNEMAEYRVVYVDVVYVKTDLSVKFLHLVPDHRNGHPYQNFTVQTFGIHLFILLFLFTNLLLLGSVPINCTIDFGDAHQQTNGTNRDQYYTAYFARNYTKYGQYNVSARCYNELSSNITQITRTIRRENMNRKMLIHYDLMETSTPTRFSLPSKEDYSFRHGSCLHLTSPITQAQMGLIWRRKTLEVIPTEVSTLTKNRARSTKFFFSLYLLVNISINLNVILFRYNHI